MGFLGVSADGFARAGTVIGAASLPCAIIQEGGYNVDIIEIILTHFLGGLTPVTPRGALISPSFRTIAALPPG